MLRRFWSAESGIFLGIWVALMFFGRSALLRDPGTFWHVVVGQKMLLSAEVIRHDPFSFTFAGQPWVAHQWLAECGMAAAYRLGGWDALLLLAVTLLAGIYTWVAARLLRAGLHPLPAALLLALVLLASSPQFHVRPLILSLGLLGWTFALLVDVEAGRKRLRQLWPLVPLAAVWANLHGGVLAGLGTLALCWAGWCLMGLMERALPGPWHSPLRRPRNGFALAGLLLLAGLAVLVNPYGLDLPRAWLETLTIPLPGLIREHARLDPTDPIGALVLALGVGYVVLLAGVSAKRLRVTWLLPLVWFALAWGRVRNVPLFAVTAAIAAADVLPHTRWAKWLQRREMFCFPPAHPAATFRRHNWLPAVLPLVVVAAAVVLQVAGVSAPMVGRGWARFDPARWPAALVDELQRLNRTSPEKTRVFNDLNFGGLVIFHAPRLRVFVDDRCALYGSQFLQAYDRARRQDPAQLDRWQREYGFRYALVESGGNFDRHLKGSAEWRPQRTTPAANLYRRDD